VFMTKSAKHTPGYPPEFRAEAIRLSRTSGKPNTQIAQDLGMTTETLRKWREASRLAVILDAFSRRVVGWSMADHLRTELVLAALGMAVWNRHPREGLIHHSDHGCQYTASVYALAAYPTLTQRAHHASEREDPGSGSEANCDPPSPATV
jgi:transposase InsO family protein